MHILVIQSHPLDPPGILGECVLARGGSLEIVIPLKGDTLPPDSTAYEGLILMGGAMNAEDDAHYPHLSQSIELIRDFYAYDKPILGICLGSQLIARAFGKRVYPHSQMELGFTPVFATPAATTDPLLRHSAMPVYVMQWHEDTFDLPDEATLLLTGEVCDRQGYKIGETVYGFQFHPEVTRSILQDWLVGSADFLQTHAPNFPTTLAEQTSLFLAESEIFCRNLGHAWLDRVANQSLKRGRKAL